MKVLHSLDLTNQQINNLASPSVATDAANKQYVDNAIAGISWLNECRVASTANITISSPGTTINGVTMASGDRVLLKNQTTGSQNGTYIFNGSSSAMTRTTDVLSAGDIVPVVEGTVSPNSSWQLITADPITIGTTSLTFQIFSAGTVYTQGNGINITGVTISAVADTGITVGSSGIGVDFSIVPKKYAVSVGNGSSTSIAVTHNIGTKDVVVEVRDNATDTVVFTDWVATSTTVVTLTFAVAPTTNQYRVVVIG